MGEIDQNLTASTEQFDMLSYFSSSEFWNDGLAVALTVSLFVFTVVLLILVQLYHGITKSTFPGAYVEPKPKPVKVEEVSVVMKALTDAVPIEEEHTIMMDHEYDGIRELDNNLPPWWKYGFYFTILIAVTYLTHYHIMELGPSSAEEYKQEMLDAEREVAQYMKLAGDIVTVDNVTYLEDGVSLIKGGNLFQKNCKSCHRPDGGGDIGPNLTDKYWINGGDIKSIFNVVANGKGAMPAWNANLSPKELQQVVSYINSIQGSNPAGAKEPQGDLFE